MTLYEYCNAHGEYGQQLQSEWVGISVKNRPVDITKIPYNSDLQVWWRCSLCKKEWIRSSKSRAVNKSKCPHCVKRQRGIRDRRSLLNWSIEHIERGKRLQSEWIGQLEDGTPIRMESIASYSTVKVMWKCSKCNNIWAMAVNKRTAVSYNLDCPKCLSNSKYNRKSVSSDKNSKTRG